MVGSTWKSVWQCYVGGQNDDALSNPLIKYVHWKISEVWGWDVVSGTQGGRNGSGTPLGTISSSSHGGYTDTIQSLLMTGTEYITPTTLLHGRCLDHPEVQVKMCPFKMARQCTRRHKEYLSISRIRHEASCSNSPLLLHCNALVSRRGKMFTHVHYIGTYRPLILAQTDHLIERFVILTNASTSVF